MSGALPDLIVIGATRCGTTSLHHYLDEHPDISMSRIKETNFFLDPELFPTGTWDRGLEWYRSQFDPAARIRGESSPNYANLPLSEGCAARMKEIVPDAKLVYMVRDPFERMASQYALSRATGVETRGFEEAVLAARSPYLAASLYMTQLKPFLERFDRAQLVIESRERLLAQRDAVLARILGFLGIDGELETRGLERRWEATEGRGRSYRAAWALAAKAQSRGIYLPRALRWPIQRALRWRPFRGRPVPKPEIPATLRRQLEPRLRDEADRLREVADLEFVDWSV